MTSESDRPRPGAPDPREVQLGLQRDANERLLLALVREAERADRAEVETGATKEREAILLEVAAFRERLIGIVGHDLRNPLNAMMMAAGLLLASDELSPSNQRLAGRVLDAARRMQRIILQVLEFTRARLGGGFALDLAHVDLGDVCRRVLSELTLASSRDAKLTEDGDVSGTWDGELLGEALSNVIGNAFEHAAPRTTIEIELLERDGDVIASVTNDGPLIPPEIAAHLFDPFRRPGAPAPRGGHLGLGLYVAHEIVRAHGGLIEVRSGDGRTRFTIKLPRAVAVGAS